MDMLEHLKSRGMNPDLYGVTYNEDEADFPLRTLTGAQVGLLRYRPDGDKKTKDVDNLKYKVVMPKGTMAFFGVETLAYPGPVFLTEGVFKACKMHNLGYAAVTHGGADPKHIANQIFLLKQHRTVVTVGDNDDAGRKFAQYLGGFTSPKDLDEMTDDEVKSMLSLYNL